MSRILVAYATKKGSTQEVAQAIARTLSERGLDVEVRPAREVTELGHYDGVVLGSALYMGKIHEDARAFLRRHHHALASLQVAVFGMGPKTMAEADVTSSRTQLDRALARHPEIEPVSVAIFGGVVDPAKLHFPFSRMPASDARDWDAIGSWASELAGRLGEEALATLA